MSQHDEKRPIGPTPPSTPSTPPPHGDEEEVSSNASVYKFAALFFGIPLILIIVMMLMSN